ncbi:MAG: MFS transporter [Burkholderiaceae bacterium]|nr:MFS transporter [Burkholderiaceae bacterium]
MPDRGQSAQTAQVPIGSPPDGLPKESSARAGVAPHDGLSTPQRYWAALVLRLALIVSVLDSTMSNVALPAIAQELGIDAASVVWVVIAYNLTVVVSLLPLSAVAERIGFRRLFTAGITLFMIASVGSALAGSLLTLMISRIAQGFGAAMLMCLFGGLVRNIYPLKKLGMGISINAMVVGLTAVIGPAAGAFILQIASWQWIFLVNVPICLVTYAGIRFLPEIPRAATRFDWVAAALGVPAFGLAIVGLEALVREPIMALLCLLVAGLAGWALLYRSRTQVSPLVPLDLLRVMSIRFAVGASAFSFASQMSAFVALPFYFHRTLSYSYGDIGIMLGAWSIGVAVMAPVAGFLSGRFSIAVLCGIGAGSMALGLLWLMVAPGDTGFAWLFAAMLLSGVGFGFFQTPNNRALLAGVPRQRSGAAGGLQATTRVFGQSFGTALVGLSFGLSQGYGPMLGMGVAVACALAAVAINVVRYLNPAADPELL